MDDELNNDAVADEAAGAVDTPDETTEGHGDIVDDMLGEMLADEAAESDDSDDGDADEAGDGDEADDEAAGEEAEDGEEAEEDEEEEEDPEAAADRKFRASLPPKTQKAFDRRISKEVERRKEAEARTERFKDRAARLDKELESGTPANSQLTEIQAGIKNAESLLDQIEDWQDDGEASPALADYFKRHLGTEDPSRKQVRSFRAKVRDLSDNLRSDFSKAKAEADAATARLKEEHPEWFDPKADIHFDIKDILREVPSLATQPNGHELAYHIHLGRQAAKTLAPKKSKSTSQRAGAKKKTAKGKARRSTSGTRKRRSVSPATGAAADVPVTDALGLF